MIKFNLQNRIDEVANEGLKELGLSLVGGILFVGGFTMYINHLGKLNECSGKLEALKEIQKIYGSNLENVDKGIDTIDTLLKAVKEGK